MDKTVSIQDKTLDLEQKNIPEHLRDRKDFGVIEVFLTGTPKEQRAKQKKLNDFILSEEF